MLDAVDRFARGLFSWGLLFVIIGWSPGIGAWHLFRGPVLKISSSKNKTPLEQPERYEALLWGAVSLVIVAAIYALALWWKRRRDTSVPRVTVLKGLNRKFLVLVTLPFLGAILRSQLEGKYDFTNLFLIGVSAAVFCTWAYAVLSERQASMPLPRVEPLWRHAVFPWLAVWAMVLLYGVGLSYLSIVDHRALQTANWDLGIYDNTVWNTVHGDFLGCSFCRAGKHYSAHFDPILAILTPFYKMSPRAETLLIFQSFWLALGGIPLFLYARRTFGHAWWACAVVAAYCFMPALHGANLYDFHSLALLIPTAIFAIYFLDADRFLGYGVSIAVLLLTREDMSLLCCCIALYAWFTGRKRAAVVTVVVSLLYFAAIKGVLMGGLGVGFESEVAPKARSYTWYYEELIPFRKEGPAGLLVSVLTDPVRALLVLFSEKKVLYFITLLMPLLFLPLVSGKKRILMLYGLLFIGLATRKYVYSSHFQYSSLLIPFLAMSVADAIITLRRARWVQAFGWSPARLQKSLLLGIVFTSLLMGSQYGVLLPNKSFRTGFERLTWSLSEPQSVRYDELREFIERIPPDAAIATDKNTGPHVSNRKTAKQWPDVKAVDYVLLRDRSRRSRRSKTYKKLIADGTFVVDHESTNFVLLRRPDEAERGEQDLDEAHQDPKE